MEAMQSSESEDEANPPELSNAKERVRQFRTIASGIAQKLAELMSVAPVSPAIVDLIRQTLLREAGPVHVAEVFMGGLMQAKTAPAPEPEKPPTLEFDFAPGVRTILSDSVPRSVTASVLNAVSSYIAERLGLNIKTFDALLRIDFQGIPGADDMMIPFRDVATQILERMGGEYAVISAQLSTQPRVTPPSPEPDPDDLYPLLQTFKFREAILVFNAQEEETAENTQTTESEPTQNIEDEIRRYGLTEREAKVWELYRRGLTVEAIAQELKLSPNEVERRYLRDIEAKRQLVHFLGEGIRPELAQCETASIGTETKGNVRNFRTLWLRPSQKTELVIRRSTQRTWQYVEDLGNGVELEMASIPAGTFVMGSPNGEEGRRGSEGPQHEVTFANSYFIAKYPIIQAQWRVVAAMPQVERELAPDPSNFKGDNRPVEKISWLDAVEFCARLSQHTGRDYRLPSEAEWEYACRAGTTTPFHFGETITSDLANYRANVTYGSGPKGKYREQTTEVASFPANSFGLYDMHGNVWEWCQDWWHETYEGAPNDGSAWLAHEDTDEEKRVLRGGSWYGDPEFCRSAYRFGVAPGLIGNDVGFRVVCGGART
jgi:formylglycine-generating enzyme required for sulfatase activity/DNA-binding CsgD family transcriptional regulator